MEGREAGEGGEGDHAEGRGTVPSTVMGLFTWPEMQNNLVPLLFLRPMLANHCGPRRRMVGDTATVSTLVTVVGQPYSPVFAGKGGFRLRRRGGGGGWRGAEGRRHPRGG